MNSSTPELQRERHLKSIMLREAIDNGTDCAVVRYANSLLEIDEQLNPSKEEPMTWKRTRLLPSITPFEKRALHLGADPATVYQGEDLKLYQEIKEREAEG